MFQALKSIALSLALSVPVSAQWGAVTSQPDTNRFINSQQDFGLIMPHQEVIVGMLDTTITSAGTGGGNASKVIVGSLLDYEDNCVNYTTVNSVASCEGSYELWRELEKSTSWYQAARGDTTAMFPTNYAVTVSTGNDSVKIWNRDTAELWMEFHERAGNVHSAICYTGNRLRNVAFKDGILYAPCDGVKLAIVDFLSDDVRAWGTGGQSELGLNIQTRNSQGTMATLNGDPDLASDEVEWVSVVRDPFGLKDALGRPDHWWIVNAPSNGGGSLYNPHTHTILDQASTSGDFNNVSVSDRGQIWMTYNNSGAYDNLSMIGNTNSNNTIFGQTASDWQPQLNYSGVGSGAQDLAWTSGINGTKILASNNRNSIVGENADNAYAWCDEGVYIISPTGGFGVNTKQVNSAKQRFSATVNAPYEFGDAVLALALEDNTTDSSPYGNTMTANNSPGTVAAVFGNGYSSTVSSYLSRTDTDFNAITCATDVGGYMHYWFKTASTTNPAADAELVAVDRSTGADSFRMYMGTGGNLVGYFYDTVASSNPVGNTDFADAKWHHVVWTVDCGDNLGSMYVDGVLHVSAAYTGTSALGLNVAQIGAKEGPSNYFDGIIDDVVIGAGTVSAESAAKLHAEGRKKLAMGTPVFAGDRDTGVLSDAFYSNNVVDIDALDNGMWAVAFSDANTVQVFDGRIPIQQIAAPAGTVKSVALIQSPGTDSVGVAIGTTTNLKFVQPSVNLRAAMAHQYKEPIHVGETVVVDSAGVGGIFWTANDAVNASFSAYKTDIFVLDGTYGAFTFATGVADGMHLHCSGARSATGGNDHGVLFDGGTAAAVTMSSNGRISNCGFYTAPGGAGGEQSAVYINTGSYGWFDHNVILDADAYGIYVGMNQSKILDNHVEGSDSDGIYVAATGDGSVISGNIMNSVGGTNSVNVISGANYVTITGNTGDKAFTNSGTGGLSVGNAQW